MHRRRSRWLEHDRLRCDERGLTREIFSGHSRRRGRPAAITRTCRQTVGRGAWDGEGCRARWKGLWLNADQGKNTSLQGFDLARLQLGVDYRVSRDIAISPVIGGSLGLFVSQDSPMTTDYTELADKKVNFTGFAGLAGRFDL